VLQQSTEFPSSGAFFDANQGDTSTFVALVKAAGMDPTSLKGTIIVPENKVGGLDWDSSRAQVNTRGCHQVL
jgi:hypothetical protein